MSRYPFWYSLTFAVVNWLEATASLATLGQWSPRWVMQFAGWYARRKFAKGREALK